MPTVADVENLRQKRFYAKSTQTSAVVNQQQNSPQKPENHQSRKRSRFPSGDQNTFAKRAKNAAESGHKIYSQYTDVLLQPELLKEIKGHEGNKNTNGTNRK